MYTTKHDVFIVNYNTQFEYFWFFYNFKGTIYSFLKEQLILP
jgi:hypothetical protein